MATIKRSLQESTRETLLNRELSWLDLNARVLELAADPDQPLLERVKFCGIFSSNLDEFFMVRVAGLLDQAQQTLAEVLPARPELVYPIRGQLDLADVAQLYELDRPDLKDDPWVPFTQRRLAAVTPEKTDRRQAAESMFMRRRDRARWSTRRR